MNIQSRFKVLGLAIPADDCLAVLRLRCLIIGLFCSVSNLTSGQIADPHQFYRVSPLPDHSVSLELGGAVPVAFKFYFDLFLLESSTDLASWTPLASVLRSNATTSTLLFVDTNAAALPQKFYRMPTNVLITPFPLPSGPLAVGTFARMLTDPSRTNRYNIKTNSSFMATFWYPAESAAQSRALYTDPKLASYRSYWSTLTNAIPFFISHAFTNAPLAHGHDQFPVIIYSHGLADGISQGGTGGGVRTENTATAVELASHGYVVVAMDHPDCYGSVFPDGTMVLRPGSFNFDALVSRLQDVQFVVEQLGQIAQTDAVFANRLALDRIGIMGWSFGGGTAAEQCRTNDQIKAAVLLDAYMDPFPVLSKGLQKPFLAMNSSTDGLAPSATTLFNKSTNNAYVLQVRNSEHETFTDLAWITEHNAATRLSAQAQAACAVSFFNKLFKNEDDHLLDAPTNRFANITAFRKKP